MSAVTTAHLSGMPAAEIVINNDVVTTLIADQHPDLAHLPLQQVGVGWDNELWRLGEDLAVRLPRRSAAASLILHEQRWLPQLAEHLTLPIPVPYRTGIPAHGYPWHWSIVPWLPGGTADQHPPAASQAPRIAAFLRSLHVPAPADAPHNPLRGVPLAHRAEVVESRMNRLASVTPLVTPRIRQIWNDALQAPIDVQPTWLHGDLHSRNVLVNDGIITAIIDWGDITSGDCATDLASLWMLFADPQIRQEAFAAYGTPSQSTLLRARGWATFYGTVLLETGLVDNPVRAAVGGEILRRLEESEL